MQTVYAILTTVTAVFIVFIIYSVNSGHSLPAVTFLQSIAYGDKLAHFVLFGCASNTGLSLFIVAQC